MANKLRVEAQPANYSSLDTPQKEAFKSIVLTKKGQIYFSTGPLLAASISLTTVLICDPSRMQSPPMSCSR